MATLTVEKYCKLLAKSKLLDEDDIKKVYNRWKESTRGSSDDDAESIRKFMIAQRLLTEYQSLLLMRGHSEGFFLDHYRILDLIAKGRMAGVYKGQDPAGQTVAIKVLPPSKAREGVMLARFLRESQLLMSLDHPNVVRALHAGESGGRHYLVMEHLDGETLEDILARRKRLPPAEAVRIVYQTLLGLQHVFEKGMIHRDLKPANIMMVSAPGAGTESTLNHNVKILDIGLGRTVFDETAIEPEDATMLTGTGVLLGTPDYMAPEQARSAREADIRSDVYSMGCVLFHLLTGQQPFPDVNLLTQIVRHATEPPRPLSDLIQPVPEGLQPVLNWMMAKDPNQRYPTPARAAQALQVFLPNPAESSAPVRTSQGTGSKTTPALKSPPPEVPVGKIEGAARKGDGSKEARKLQEGTSLPTGKTGPAPALARKSQGKSEWEASTQEDFDVELVAMPNPSVTRPAGRDAERAILEFDRRDIIVAGAGGTAVLLAVGAGYALSRLFKSFSPAPAETEKEK